MKKVEILQDDLTKENDKNEELAKKITQQETQIIEVSFDKFYEI